jgi:hypothetical protein
MKKRAIYMISKCPRSGRGDWQPFGRAEKAAEIEEPEKPTCPMCVAPGPVAVVCVCLSSFLSSFLSIPRACFTLSMASKRRFPRAKISTFS